LNRPRLYTLSLLNSISPAFTESPALIVISLKMIYSSVISFPRISSESIIIVVSEGKLRVSASEADKESVKINVNDIRIINFSN
jgi:hypothetical protein